MTSLRFYDIISSAECADVGFLQKPKHRLGRSPRVKIEDETIKCGRGGTSIGANVSEAVRGQSKADFSAKMCIALKEANESHYWIRLLYKTDFLTEQQFNSI